VHDNGYVLVSLLSFLRCPFCETGSPTLGVSRQRKDELGEDELVNATLKCDGCDRTTEVIDSIWHAMGNHKPQRTIAQLANVLPPVPQLYENVWRMRSMKLLTRGTYTVSEELQELHEQMKPAVERLFVDVATSEGLYARTLANGGATVFAIDHSVPFLRSVVRRRRRTPLRGRVVAIRAMAQHLPIQTGRLHGAVMGASLNEIGDQTAAVAEMGRVTVVGGNLFNMSLIPSVTSVGRAAQLVAKLGGVRFPSQGETEKLFDGAGTGIVRSETTGVVLRLSSNKR
jgi:Methyltransferase domain